MATPTDDNEADGNLGKYIVRLIWRRCTRKSQGKNFPENVIELLKSEAYTIKLLKEMYNFFLTTARKQ